MKITNIILAATAAVALAGPAFAVHGPFSASGGKAPGGTTADNKPQPAGRAAGENGEIASGAHPDKPGQTGVNSVIDSGDGNPVDGAAASGGLFPDQRDAFPGGRKN